MSLDQSVGSRQAFWVSSMCGLFIVLGSIVSGVIVSEDSRLTPTKKVQLEVQRNCAAC